MTSSSALGTLGFSASTSLNNTTLLQPPPKAKATASSLVTTPSALFTNPAGSTDKSAPASLLFRDYNPPSSSASLATSTVPLTKFSASDMTQAQVLSTLGSNSTIGTSKPTDVFKGANKNVSKASTNATSLFTNSDKLTADSFSLSTGTKLTAFNSDELDSSNYSFANPNLAAESMSFGFASASTGLSELLDKEARVASTKIEEKKAESPSLFAEFFRDDKADKKSNKPSSFLAKLNNFFKNADKVTSTFGEYFSSGTKTANSSTPTSSPNNLGKTTFNTYTTTAEAVRAVDSLADGQTFYADSGTRAELINLRKIDSSGRKFDQNNVSRLGQFYANALALQSKISSSPEDALQYVGQFSNIQNQIHNFVGRETYESLLGSYTVASLSPSTVENAKQAGTKIKDKAKALQTAPTQGKAQAKAEFDATLQSTLGSTASLDTNRSLSAQASVSGNASSSESSFGTNGNGTSPSAGKTSGRQTASA